MAERAQTFDEECLEAEMNRAVTRLEIAGYLRRGGKCREAEEMTLQAVVAAIKALRCAKRVVVPGEDPALREWRTQLPHALRKRAVKQLVEIREDCVEHPRGQWMKPFELLEIDGPRRRRRRRR